MEGSRKQEKGEIRDGNPGEVDIKKEDLMKLLDLTSQRLRHHHDALWQEEKHYTWWIYIVAGAIIFIYLNKSLPLLQKTVLVACGSFLGIFVSWIGYNVVCREGRYLNKSVRLQNRIISALGLDMPVKCHDNDKLEPLLPQTDLPKEANKTSHEFICAIFNDFKRCTKRGKQKEQEKRSRQKEIGIRDCFQVVFVMSTLLFVIILWISVIYLFCFIRYF